jgi:hypothetical protein
MLSSSDKKGGKGEKTYLLGPLVELASDLDQVFCLLPPFYLMTKAEFSFGNVMIL